MVSEQEAEWTTVSLKSNKKHTKRVSSKESRAVQGALSISQTLQASSAIVEPRSAAEEDMQCLTLHREIDRTIELLRLSDFFRNRFLRHLEDIIELVAGVEGVSNSRCATGIVALGVGSLSGSSSSSSSSSRQSSLWQFSLLVLLKDTLAHWNKGRSCSAPSVYCFEPNFDTVDHRMCQHYHITMLSENTKGLFRPSDVDDFFGSEERPLIFFMPHCPFRLYCNVLWSAWRYLSRSIVIGNRFVSYMYSLILFLLE
jgi:hypothetical protein